MMWYLQLLVEHLIFWSGNDIFVDAVFAALALWAGFGGSPKICGVATAMLYLALAFF
jgi:hypothetical protein